MSRDSDVKAIQDFIFDATGKRETDDAMLPGKIIITLMEQIKFLKNEVRKIRADIHNLGNKING